jgi:hypothetical protein
MFNFLGTAKLFSTAAGPLTFSPAMNAQGFRFLYIFTKREDEKRK